ncbi:hypothetical protein AB0L63_24320 [Nocardia sp. NPDC051990]|uniref:hypothetical protein n=1 Tax=Nocardia sp. NPDC051990 TaxID=3155285 RepID=UPI003422A436
MVIRLDEIAEDLLLRRQRAETAGWQGEIEGLDLSLTLLRDKREQARKLGRIAPVSLGMPSPGGRPE